MRKVTIALLVFMSPLNANALVKAVDYGVVCDGLTDDLAAINSAITAAGANDIVQFPKGVCRISDTIIHWDSGAAPVKHTFRGEGPYSTFIWHTGNQATGAIRIESDAVRSGSAWASRQAGGVCFEDISIGSVGGPALTQFFSNRNVHHRVGFFSAHPDHPYFSIQGSIQGSYFSLFDLRGGDGLPNDVVALMDQSGTRTDPRYGVEITSGDYAGDGYYGNSQEHFFFEMRMNGGPTRETVHITKKSITAGNSGSIYFIGCKIDAPDNVEGTDYPGLFVDGGYDVHFIGGAIEQGNPTTAHAAIRVDNQIGNSFLYVDNAFMVSSGYIDIGTPGLTSGIGKIELAVSNSNFYKLRDNYNSSGTNVLSLVNTKWAEQSVGVDPSKMNKCNVVGGYVTDGNTYANLNISCGGVSGAITGDSLAIGGTNTIGTKDIIAGQYGPLLKSTGGWGYEATDVWNAGTTGDNVFTIFRTDADGVNRGGIDYNRATGSIRYNTNSDANLKTVTGNASAQESVDILNGVKVREFYWKEDKYKRKQSGAIAQELYKVFPESVSVGSESRPWMVDKTAFTYHLINGFQYHQKEILELRKEIDMLKNKSK